MHSFRALDRKYGRTLPVVQVDYIEHTVTVHRETVKGWVCESERHSFRNEKTDRFLLLISTGLIDKKGNPIYEGDLLKDLTLGKDAATFIVVYLRDSARFTLYKIDTDESGFGLGALETDLEIIGNRYDNPGLIPENGEKSGFLYNT